MPRSSDCPSEKWLFFFTYLQSLSRNAFCAERILLNHQLTYRLSTLLQCKYVATHTDPYVNIDYCASIIYYALDLKAALVFV
jgi:hypothetical protein